MTTIAGVTDRDQNAPPASPLVSVVIPAYNHERLVEGSIRSVLDQTYPDIELVVVDDGSTDGTWQAIQRAHAASGGRFKMITKANQGVSATLNLGISQTRGTYVAVLASDDCFLPHKIEKQLALLRGSPEDVALVHSGAFEEFGEGYLVEMTGQYTPAIGRCFNDLVARRVTAIAPTVMFTRAVYDEVGGFDENLVGEDLDFYAAVAARGHALAFDPEPLIVKSKPPNNLGANVERYFDDPFKTLAKYADRFSSDEYRKMEDGFFDGMARAATGAGKLRLAWRLARQLARRTSQIRPYGDFLKRSGRHLLLRALPPAVRHQLRARRVRKHLQPKTASTS